MASSNRHWPSMFKSKPCNQWQHDISPSLLSNGCHRPSSFTSSVAGGEERSPEPKPRWNPKPEQIRILEAIFNSGMVNPPRDEIRRIRAQLQEYGQVGDANVFYWFQNRKSRSKHKQRHLQSTKQQHQLNQTTPPTTTTTTTATAATVPSSSSSSSEKSSPKSAEFIPFSLGPGNVVDMVNSPTASVNQTYFQTPGGGGEFLPEPFFFPASTQGGYCFPEMGTGGAHLHDVNNCSGGFLLSDLLNGPTKKMMMEDDDHRQKLKLLQEEMNYTASASVPATSVTTTPHSFVTPPHSSITTVPSPTNHILGVGIGETPLAGLAKSTVFINDVAFEVSVGPFNVRESFGDDAVLINSSGHPVLTNAWGVTLQSLQHGGVYYLLRTIAPVSSHLI